MPVTVPTWSTTSVICQPFIGLTKHQIICFDKVSLNYGPRFDPARNGISSIPQLNFFLACGARIVLIPFNLRHHVDVTKS